MSHEPNRQPEGIPTGGQYAAAIKSDNVPSLGAPTRRPELDGWPESLPEPVVTFSIGEDGAVTTTATVPNGDEINVWTKNNGSDGYDGDAMGSWDGVDDDEMERAEEWLTGRHEIIASAVRAEQNAAVDRTRAAILASATGVSVQQSDEDLEKIIDASFVTYNAVKRDGELASTALIARGVLKEHPDAHAIGLVVSTGDDTDYVSGAVVYNENREQIGYYDEEDTFNTEGDRPDRPFLQHLASLNPISDNAWWTQFNVRPVRDREDLYTIELTKAAAWTPGDVS